MIMKKTSDDRIHEMHAELCRMLSHPTRLKILEQLNDEQKTVGEIVDTLYISQPTISQHLSKLKKKWTRDSGKRWSSHEVRTRISKDIGCV